ncbi:efflux transporter outer membrane subunit [Variovorax terrae]|uniref:Efflux transporter outer membrane subunit n=1 Tax=Variovorax terrae TaxID=2923278 RepID=A0A9X1VZK4_9BURK|nr:efflux transporter outer membrane subunit [Variovorax terrae]MCJ0765825.1 efflux transporter outer membrane subunit [Variovorax terrae]
MKKVCATGHLGGRRRWPLLVLPLWLAACAVPTPPAAVPSAAPVQWQAPLPHNGRLADLTQWWQQFNDPLLVQLIEAAQAASPNVASARATLEQARATRVSAGAALLPSAQAVLNTTRQNDVATTRQLTISDSQQQLQFSWEIDVFGHARAARNAAQARLEGAQALWHDARVSVAAEVANQYIGYRSCEQLLATARADAQSRAETARLTELSTRAGFESSASAALARASAAQGASQARQQQAECDVAVKVLVELAALDEPALRRQLAQAGDGAALPQPATLQVADVPAQVLAQRPDMLAAEREVVASSADVGASLANRYPSLSLTGAIGRERYNSGARGAHTLEGSTWTLGPLALTLPLFDGGARAAQTGAARARYTEAVNSYRAKVRTAVREVEEALVRLDSTGARAEDAQHAVDGYRSSLAASQARYQGGLGNLFELEEARRLALQAETAWIALQRERVGAWIALYRAVGGGWSRPTDDLAKN